MSLVLTDFARHIRVATGMKGAWRPGSTRLRISDAGVFSARTRLMSEVLLNFFLSTLQHTFFYNAIDNKDLSSGSNQHKTEGRV